MRLSPGLSPLVLQAERTEMTTGTMEIEIFPSWPRPRLIDLSGSLAQHIHAILKMRIAGRDLHRVSADSAKLGQPFGRKTMIRLRGSCAAHDGQAHQCSRKCRNLSKTLI